MKLIILKDILTCYLNKFALAEKTQKIYQLWETEIGNLVRHSQLLGVKGGYLEVEVDSPVALQEFFLRKDKIIQQLNKKISAFGGSTSGGGKSEVKDNYLKGIHFHPVRNYKK